MKYTKIIFAIAVVFFVLSCKHNPITNPEATKAQAEMDQVKYLDSIHQQLKRIADKMERK